MPESASTELRLNGQVACVITEDCTRHAVEVCLSCGRPFCPDHASSIDPKLCLECLSPKDADIERSPLVDEEGVTHVGSVLTPGPYYNKTYAARIVEMTDDELANHISAIKDKVREAETTLDRRRVELSMATVEQEDRDQEKRRKLRGVKIKGLTSVANGEAKKKVQGTVDALGKIAAALGIKLDTPEAIAKFGSMLLQMNKAKAK